MAKKIIAANWKMHGTQHSVQTLLSEVLEGLTTTSSHCQVILFPPVLFLPLLAACLTQAAIQYGAQTVSEYEDGAYTGEISTTMLRDAGCKYVLVGHSERRQLFAETSAMVAKKFARAQQANLIPMLCVGETEQQRAAEQTMAVIEEQLQAVIDIVGVNAFSKAVVAYEPVWAIGTGKTATPEQAQAVHGAIRKFFAERDTTVAQQLSLLYGGSVKAENAAALFKMPDINGALVGGASLDAKQFLSIVRAI